MDKLCFLAHFWQTSPASLRTRIVSNDGNKMDKQGTAVRHPSLDERPFSGSSYPQTRHIDLVKSFISYAVPRLTAIHSCLKSIARQKAPVKLAKIGRRFCDGTMPPAVCATLA